MKVAVGERRPCLLSRLVELAFEVRDLEPMRGDFRIRTGTLEIAYEVVVQALHLIVGVDKVAGKLDAMLFEQLT